MPGVSAMKWCEYGVDVLGITQQAVKPADVTSHSCVCLLGPCDRIFFILHVLACYWLLVGFFGPACSCPHAQREVKLCYQYAVFKDVVVGWLDGDVVCSCLCVCVVVADVWFEALVQALFGCF